MSVLESWVVPFRKGEDEDMHLFKHMNVHLFKHMKIIYVCTIDKQQSLVSSFSF